MGVFFFINTSETGVSMHFYNSTVSFNLQLNFNFGTSNTGENTAATQVQNDENIVKAENEDKECEDVAEYETQERKLEREVNETWRDRKLKSLELAYSYNRQGLRAKCEKIVNCSTYLKFGIEGHKTRLVQINSCKLRLCPYCAWRRSLKVYSETSRIIQHIRKKEPFCHFIHLTLTIRNCKAKDLSDTITKILKSFDRLMKRTEMKRIIKGFMRCLEVTYNAQKNTFHPHIHMVFMVDRNYYDKGNYIDFETWVQYWKESLGVNYRPDVFIVPFVASEKGLGKEVAEVAKYAVKPLDYLIDGNKALTDELVRVLDAALCNRRLIAYGGLFKEIHSLLNLNKKSAENYQDEDVEEIEFDEIIVFLFNLERRMYFRHSGDID